MSKVTPLPFYQRMIALLRNAFVLLDDQGRKEVLQFIITNQNPDGGFRDRGGKSDLYYSLFGMMILRAAGRMERGAGGSEQALGRKEKRASLALEPYSKLVAGAILKLKKYTRGQKSSQVPGFIERCCLVLLQKELKVRRFSRLRSLIALGRSFMKERNSINLSYRSFVLFLTLNAVFPFPSIFKSMLKKRLSKTLVDQQSPCSEVAAEVFLVKMLNYDGTEEQALLSSFSLESGGFKAFAHLDNADMLSTAVALFALSYAGHDIRLIMPSCLDFIQQNYSEGAFLSGDGDQSADVEYTFYGLLALGVLAN
ncbi:MAG TPA: prenyltransferase/squalene oxidase repeat-containing protein [Prolixibacteraceae bacterium]|jgi:hypothetical protein